MNPSAAIKQSQAPQPSRLIALLDDPENALDEDLLDGEWPDRTISRVIRPELHAFEVPNPKGRALVCPGGGYVRLMYDTEGADIAAWLNSLGYDAYVLVHRLPGADDSAGDIWPADIALRDGMLAMDWLAKNGELPSVLVGLSSGGHLAGVLACQDHKLAARGVIITYAPINANHKDYKYPAGKPDYPPLEKQAFYNAWPIGIAAEAHGVPKIPVFLTYALGDQIVPVEHALNLIRTARDSGLDVDAHIFGQAPHGFSLRETDGTHDAWPELAARWLARKL